MGNLYLLIFENKYHEASSLIGISPFYPPPPRTCQRIRITPSTTKPGMEGPLTAQTGQITPRLVLLVVFTDVAGGPHLSSSPLSLSTSTPLPPSLQRRRPSSAVASLPPSATVRHRCPPAPPSLPLPCHAAAARPCAVEPLRSTAPCCAPLLPGGVPCSATPRPAEPLRRRPPTRC
jgi:hypothetical protein